MWIMKVKRGKLLLAEIEKCRLYIRIASVYNCIEKKDEKEIHQNINRIFIGVVSTLNVVFVPLLSKFWVV